MRPLLSAISFLTILPVPRSIHADRGALARAPGWYPFVGLLIGLAAAVGFKLCGGLPAIPRAVIAVLIPVVLTRALHLDGFADVCDGLGVYGPPAKRLLVMRDPRLGTFGVTGIALNLLWRVAMLASPIRFAATALVAAPVLGRWAMVLALRWLPYERSGGFGAAAIRPGAWALLGATLVLILPFLKAPGPVLGGIILTTILARWSTGYARRQFGGLTGDALGALNELVELCVLAVFLIACR